MSENDPQPRRLKRFERSAIGGVMAREIINFGSYWRATTFSSTVEPTIYLLAFGLGLGTILNRVAGYDYLDFVATGTVATAVLFSSAFPAMFGSFVKREFQRTYDAILAAPVDTEELVTAEVLWIACRAGVFGCAPILVAVVFGLSPHWTVIFVPIVAFTTGFAFASVGTLIAALVSSIDNFSYVTSALLTPLMLVAGTFFPISNLPRGARIAAEFNPLHHCVELVRCATFGTGSAATILARYAVLVAFGLLIWRLAIWRSRLRLIG